MKVVKTNAMRILDREGLNYAIHTYTNEGSDVDGYHVCEQLQLDPDLVFKTLLCVGSSKQYYVFVVPVAHELDLKKCAKVVHEKNIAMTPVKDLQKLTGYIRGGCSPIGMKKQFQTVFHNTCCLYDHIYFSGGKIGCQIEMKAIDVITLLSAKTDDIVK